MLRRVSMTTCCSPPASHPRSSRCNILQHVSLMLTMRLRSVMDASFNVHSIFCWHSSRSVRVIAAGHSFPSSPLGFLKEHPSDRMYFRDWRVEMRQATPTVSRCAFRSSAKTPAPQHTLLQTQNTISARARTAAGSRERGRPRAVPEVFCENHLREVSMCTCSKKDGSAFFAKRRHCTMVQSRLTRAKEQNHSFTSNGMCVLRRFHRAQLACRGQHHRQLLPARHQRITQQVGWTRKRRLECSASHHFTPHISVCHRSCKKNSYQNYYKKKLLAGNNCKKLWLVIIM